MTSDLLRNLNPEQREAVSTTEGPVLVLAGAGSGKTRVIIHRIAYILSKGVDADRILAVTFTNKAANEMRERIRGLADPTLAEGLTISTFHSFGLMMIRRSLRRLGLSPGAMVIDESDRDAMIRQVRVEMGLTDKDLTVDDVRLFLMQVKGCGADPDELADSFGYRKAALFRRFYDNYTRRLRIAESLDFDDLILLPVQLLESDERIRDRYRAMFDYVMVDEYQDTNYLQFRLLKALVDERRNVCVVGDDDQSIYGWRGARVENILEFDTHFPGAKIVKLTRNYRSERNILQLANAVISANRTRRTKELWTENADEVPARKLRFDSQLEEARQIAEQVRDMVRTNLKANEVVVLYRTKGQSKLLQEAFRMAGVPYRVVGSYDFFERKEIRDLLAYFKLVCNPHDQTAFRRIVNYPARGVGLATLEKLEAYRKGSRAYLSAASALLDAEGHLLNVRTRRSLSDFVALIERYHGQVSGLEGERLVGVMEQLILESGMKDELILRGTNALKALSTLVSMLRRGIEAGTFNTLAQFLERIAMEQREADYQGETPQELVTLMTVHAAKGLEFEAVFVVGLVDGLFPHFRSVEEFGLEEERRLFYVAITRARRHLFLSTFKQREDRGEVRPCRPSRFLTELPSKLLHAGGRDPAGFVSKEDLLARFEDFEKQL